MPTNNPDWLNDLPEEKRRIIGQLIAKLPEIVRKYMGEKVLGFVQPEDIAQEVLITVGRSIHRFKQMTDDLAGDLGAWFRTFVRRAVIDAAGRSRKQAEAVENDILEAARGAGTEPERRVAREQAIHFLCQCVQKLTPDDRRFLAARTDQDLTFSELGAVFGLSEDAARRRLLSIHARLRTMMGSSSNYSFGTVTE